MDGSRMCSSIPKAQLLCCMGLEGFDQLLVMERASWHHSGLVWFLLLLVVLMCFPCGSGIKNLSANAGDMGSIPGSGRSSGGGNGNPLQYSCLGNTMDRGAWWATIHRVIMSRTWLKLLRWLSTHAHRVMCRVNMRTDVRNDRLQSWDWRAEWRAATAPRPLYAVSNVFLILQFVPLSTHFPLVTLSLVSASVTQFLFCK